MNKYICDYIKCISHDAYQEEPVVDTGKTKKCIIYKLAEKRCSKCCYFCKHINEDCMIFEEDDFIKLMKRETINRLLHEK